MVDFVTRKSMIIRESGRSTDFISPSFGHGCLFNCTYCYMKRHKHTGLNIATNTDDILNAIKKHRESLPVKVANQTHTSLWTYDISCNEDFCLHLKHHNWKKIFKFFLYSKDLMASFATKYVNEKLLQFYPTILETKQPRIRVRMSLMPEKYRRKLEPNTSPIGNRIIFINKLITAGYEAHINFSPVIVYPGALELYKELFIQINSNISDKNKNKVKCEVIFLTHNEKKHQYNLDNNLNGEELLWRPEIQEAKTSQYGGKNIRYKYELKRKLIKEFTDLHDSIIPWNTIRYIF